MIRVAVTGVGAVSPAGVGIAATHGALRSGRTYIRSLRGGESVSTSQIGAPACSGATASTRVQALAEDAIAEAVRTSDLQSGAHVGLAFGTAISCTLEIEQA